MNQSPDSQVTAEVTRGGLAGRAQVTIAAAALEGRVAKFDRRKARDVVTEECVLRTHGLTVEEVLDLLAGCWTGDPITLADLNASEYDSLVVDTMAQRDNALGLLAQIRDLNEEAHRDKWSALGIYSGIRALLKKGGNA